MILFPAVFLLGMLAITLLWTLDSNA